MTTNVNPETLPEKRNLSLTVKMIETLAHSGHKPDSAFADLIDNSIDANASDIRIVLDAEDNKLSSFKLSDNGTGMDLDTLIKAVTPGSDTSHHTLDLGKYGIGLNTSLLNFGDMFFVFSKRDMHQPVGVKFDLEDMRETGEVAVTPIPTLTDNMMRVFKSMVPGNSGTFIFVPYVIRHRMPMVNRSRFDRKLHTKLGQTFYHFMVGTENEDGSISPPQVSLQINGEQVLPLDPMHRDTSDVLYSKQEHFTVEDTDGTQHEVTFKLETFILKDSPTLQQQGYYVYRNGRMVADAREFEIFKKHPTTNNIRHEIHFDDSMDAFFNVDLLKLKVQPSEDIIEHLSRIYDNTVQPYITEKKYERERARKADEARQAQEQAIQAPAAGEAQPASSPAPVIPARRKAGTSNVRRQGERRFQEDKARIRELDKKANLPEEIDYVLKDLGMHNELFSTRTRGDKLIVTLNSDHIYVQKLERIREEHQDVYESSIRLLVAMAQQAFYDRHTKGVVTHEVIRTYIGETSRRYVEMFDDQD